MKLVQLSTRYPPGTGGVERHVQEITSRLGARGHTVRVLTSDLLREYPWERLPRAVPRSEPTPFGAIRRLPAFSLPGALHYPFLRGLDRALAESGGDLAHVHTYGTNQLAVAARARRRRGLPFVLTAHFHPISSIEGGRMRHRLRALYDRRLAGPQLARADRLIVQSRAEEELMRALRLPLPRIEIIPPGYTPLPAPPGEADFRARFSLEGPYVAFVGRLASNKGLRTLVRAFAPLLKIDPSATLLLVGPDGGMGPVIDREAQRLGISSRLRRVGFLASEADLAGVLAYARAFALPSEYEAFGLVLLEAMGQGAPVIATPVGAIPDFVEEGRSGFLTPPGDEAALTAALERVWADPEAARRMGRYAREVIVPRYSWDATVDRLERTYREVVGP